ncbi:SDR family NAD(P)-dependent oxidoreductase [Paraburkholderia sp. JPY419]|uniref:SDR family NAD(P)-dependent oxidoreductase n=1 Tax=Paraburkholderia sp. JPY419 TaxID=667660 RepID=UPI003D21FECE
MSGKLSSKTAIITGSSRGIGRAVALAFAREGAALIGVHYGSNADAAHATVREIEALGAKAVAIKADLNRGKEATDSIWEQFKAAAIAATGEPRLDILVNNAGIAPGIPLSETSEATFDEVLRVNFKAPFFLIQGRCRSSPRQWTNYQRFDWLYACGRANASRVRRIEGCR